MVADGVKTMAIVKANAYGHGDVRVARVLEEMGCEYFGVAMVEEGIRLREGGIEAPVVVLGGIFNDQVRAIFDYDLTPVVYDLDTVERIDSLAGKRAVVKDIHVKIDTGMGRLGILPHQIGAFFSTLKGYDNIRVEGVLSHFSEMDQEDKGYSHRQLSTFVDALDRIKGLGYNPSLVHMANSAAIVEFRESHFNLIRPGIMLYGSYPSKRFSDRIHLKPVMTLKTCLVYLKKLPSGFPVSYGRTYVTKKESTIGILPIGYGDGLPRRLSGRGEVLVRGKRVPIVGMVCMDFTMCDLTDVDDARVGDEVVIIGSQGDDTITVEEMAERTGTITYEIFCNISTRVPRLYT